ncbi:hypothetical protein [Lutibacter citreus]|uniref:hypothetical protein n=1 Tax=Lutibacter citreus TaxID=2138210 RepID=UPI000DBE66C2|nr:hypothetical protein [Lutibacter citreus]
MILPLVKKITLIIIFLTAFQIAGQEIGNIYKNNHFIKLNKTASDFCLIYSDINSNNLFFENSIQFSNKETIYNIIINGFKKKNNHQVFIKTNNNIIVKLKYIHLRGEKLLSIKHNNLSNKTRGQSHFFTQEDFEQLFSSTI